MTTATQTPAGESVQAEGHIDPAATLVSGFVPVQTRSERPTSFDPSDFAVPTGREVNWKHTPLTDKVGSPPGCAPGRAPATPVSGCCL